MKFLLEAMPVIGRKKKLPKALFSSLEDKTRIMILISYLLGRIHVKEAINRELIFRDMEISGDEAVDYLLNRLSMSREDFYSLDGQARFMAFTIAYLTGLDAIERVKTLLAKALDEGLTIKEWVKSTGEEAILKTVGFHEENPYYLETVYRTNLSAAYNAGKWREIQENKADIAFLEYVTVEDDRRTEICTRLDGVRKPVDDPFWNDYYTPNHFNERSTVRTVSNNEAELLKLKPTEEIITMEIPEGFRGNPGKDNTWWDLKGTMKQRAAEYGILEIIEKERSLFL